MTDKKTFPLNFPEEGFGDFVIISLNPKNDKAHGVYEILKCTEESLKSHGKFNEYQHLYRTFNVVTEKKLEAVVTKLYEYLTERKKNGNLPKGFMTEEQADPRGKTVAVPPIEEKK